MREALLASALLLSAAAAPAARAQSQVDLNQAAGADFTAADKAMNLAYNRLLDKISPAGRKALIAAQRSWLRFRDEECDFETMATLGGSIHSMEVTICRTRLTRVRLADLKAQINCQQGDPSCGDQ